MTTKNEEMTEQAMRIAKLGLYDIKRKYNDQDSMFDHSVRVAMMASLIAEPTNATTQAMYLCAGVLHDVVEDTVVTHVDIAKDFPPHIAWTVERLTKKEHQTYFEYIASICNDPAAVYIKIADLIDNMTSGEIPESLMARYQKALEMCLDKVADRSAVEKWVKIFMEAEDHSPASKAAIIMDHTLNKPNPIIRGLTFTRVRSIVAEQYKITNDSGEEVGSCYIIAGAFLVHCGFEEVYKHNWDESDKNTFDNRNEKFKYLDIAATKILEHYDEQS